MALLLFVAGVMLIAIGVWLLWATSFLLGLPFGFILGAPILILEVLLVVLGFGFLLLTPFAFFQRRKNAE